jgi:AAA domain
MAQIIDRIRTWAVELKYWEQAALELIASGVDITESQYQRLLDLCMHDAGLIQVPTSQRPQLSFPIHENDVLGSGYRLARLFNLRNVNALPNGQEIVFGEHLTLIYGDNGAGKTGYVRPLASAAFTRGEREVLPNAAVPISDEVVPQADIELAKGGSKQVVTWSRGQDCKELAGFHVFDTASVFAHLTGSNAITFSPAGLSLLRRLAEVTDEVRLRLRKLLDERDTGQAFFLFFSGESAVATQIQALGAQSNLEELDRLAILPENSDARIQDLEAKIAELKSQDAPRRARELRKNAEDIQRLSASLASSELALGPGTVSIVEQLLSELDSTKHWAQDSGAERFRVDSFTQVGTDVWREFLTAAKSLGQAEGDYPNVGKPCLLCRQPLSPDATALIEDLWNFLTSDATARFEAAQRACIAKRREIEQGTMPYFGEDSGVRRVLTGVAPDLALTIEGEVEALDVRRQQLMASLQSGKLGVLAALAPSDTKRLIAIASAMESEATALQTVDIQQKQQQLSAELRDLQHRRTLCAQLTAVKSYVEKQRWILRGRQNLGSTYSITTKHNELFAEFVTDRFLELFQLNLADINRNVRVTIDTRGKKGETLRQIVLNPASFPNSCAVDGVLSEGEKRAVALADFLTEAALDDACTGVILDDPITSFDLGSRKAVARKLAELARTRQVVVFTHDLGFPYQVRAEAKILSVGTVAHWIQRGADGTPGLVFLNNGPICEGDYKSARIARDWYAKARSASPQEQQSCLEQGFGALRTSYEAFVIFDLFAGVVERWSERIKYDQLTEATLEREVVDLVVEKLGHLSRYIVAHLHSDAFVGEKPTPADLFAEIEIYESLKAKHKQMKKAAHQSNTVVKPSAQAQAQRSSPREITPPHEGVELEKRSRLINQLRNQN